MKLGILKLPEAASAVNESTFIVQKSKVTEKVTFNNLTFGLDNASFSPTISAHSTEIQYLSSSVLNLSSNIDTTFQQLSSYAVTAINNAFFQLQYTLYPVGAILQTASFINPSTLIPNTTWSLVSQGNYIAGIGTTTENGAPYGSGDKNSTSITIAAGVNTTLGEYGHSLSANELPSHNHEGSMFGETDSSINGQFAESEGGPEQFNIAPVTSDPTGGNGYHNNMPPLYGVYIWLRTA